MTASWRKTRQAVFRRDGRCCVVCGSDGWIKGHYSKSGRWIEGRRILICAHRVPAERYPGHHDDMTNLRTLCVGCNNSQRDLDDDQWRAARAARGQSVPGESVTRPVRSLVSPDADRTIFGTRRRGILVRRLEWR